MKFFFKPNMTITSKNSLGDIIKVCQFDSNGEFETDNEKLINKLKKHFKFEETKIEEPVVEEKPVEEILPPIEVGKGVTCKICQALLPNLGQLMKHKSEYHKGVK